MSRRDAASTAGFVPFVGSGRSTSAEHSPALPRVAPGPDGPAPRLVDQCSVVLPTGRRCGQREGDAVHAVPGSLVAQFMSDDVASLHLPVHPFAYTEIATCR